MAQRRAHPSGSVLNHFEGHSYEHTPQLSAIGNLAEDIAFDVIGTPASGHGSIFFGRGASPSPINDGKVFGASNSSFPFRLPGTQSPGPHHSLIGMANPGHFGHFQHQQHQVPQQQGYMDPSTPFLETPQYFSQYPSAPQNHFQGLYAPQQQQQQQHQQPASMGYNAWSSPKNMMASAYPPAPVVAPSLPQYRGASAASPPASAGSIAAESSASASTPIASAGSISQPSGSPSSSAPLMSKDAQEQQQGGHPFQNRRNHHSGPRRQQGNDLAADMSALSVQDDQQPAAHHHHHHHHHRRPHHHRRNHGYHQGGPHFMHPGHFSHPMAVIPQQPTFVLAQSGVGDANGGGGSGASPAIQFVAVPVSALGGMTAGASPIAPMTAPSYQTMMPPLSMVCLMVEVEFKRGRRSWFFCDGSLGVRPDEFVLVEADRGEDLGRAIRIIPVMSEHSRRNVHGHVFRKATQRDVLRLAAKTRDEQQASDFCRQRTEEQGHEMEIIDAEFQYDRKKLTFFYRAEARIDFRELVRELYKVYRARIWMNKISDSDEIRAQEALEDEEERKASQQQSEDSGDGSESQDGPISAQ